MWGKKQSLVEMAAIILRNPQKPASSSNRVWNLNSKLNKQREKLLLAKLSWAKWEERKRVISNLHRLRWTSGNERLWWIEMSQRDFFDFISLAYAEAGWEGRRWLVAVLYSIKNRIKHQRYPNTVHWVIYAKYKTRKKILKNEYSPLGDWSFETLKKEIKTNSSLNTYLVNIWKRVLSGIEPNPIGRATAFHSLSRSSYHDDKMRFVIKIWNHKYYELK